MSERSLRWQKIGIFAAVVSIACVVIVSFLTSVVGSTFKQQLDHDRDVAAQHQQMQLDADFATCEKANDTRAGLRQIVDGQRAMLDHVAPETPIDPAILNDPQLRSLAEVKQRADHDFREDQLSAFMDELAKLQPRDCAAERKAAGG